MKPQNMQQQIDVCIGESELPIGTLAFTQQGQRSHSAFRYTEAWLAQDVRFSISPDLPLHRDYQLRKAVSAVDSVFHHALADTAPDAWGRRVIARDHAKRRAKEVNAGFSALTEMDYLMAVDDVSRVGALRLREANGNYVRTSEGSARTTPPFIELQRMYEASRAVERGVESSADLAYLQGKGTSLGGMRPKCTVLDENGKLAIGKFPSIADARSVTKGEVLAMRLAKLAGIDVAPARIAVLEGTPVAIIERFDRVYEATDKVPTAVYKVTGRIPYLSAASMLEASRQNEHSYTEIADVIRANGSQPTADVQQLWRRMVFNHFIANVDDHLQNHGFLHTAHGQWRLAPAFDINPFPDKERESKTWLSEADGPITSTEALLGRASYFALTQVEAKQVLAQVQAAVQQWRVVAHSKAVGMTKNELDDFVPAFLMD